MEIIMKCHKLIIVALLGYAMLVGPVSAAQTFTASGTAGDGSPMNAQADFAFNGSFTSLSVTLTNTAGAGQMQHIASVFDGIAFSLSGVSMSALSLGSLSDPNGTVDCTSGCVFSATPVDLATSGWTYDSSTGLLAAGSGSFKPYGIVNDNIVAFDGIPNAQHNPYLMGPVTFDFPITNPNQILLNVASASFYFGTAPDVLVVPEPETYAMILAGLGLLGFVARRRRRQDAAI